MADSAGGHRIRQRYRAFCALSKDSVAKTLLVAGAVGLFGGMLVTASTVLLQPRYIANLEKEQQESLMAVIQRQPGIEGLLQSINARQVEARVVELASGRYIDSIDAERFDQHAAAKLPEMSVEIPPEQDLANIRRRAKHAVVYIVKQDNSVRFLLLPIHGKGYASTLYGYLGLEADGNTIVGINFYEHSETPGLGARIDNQEWRDQWHGKKARDPNGELRIGLTRGSVTANSPSAAYEIEGLTGATLTTRGVHQLIRYWLGDHGFGPYLQTYHIE